MADISKLGIFIATDFIDRGSWLRSPMASAGTLTVIERSSYPVIRLLTPRNANICQIPLVPIGCFTQLIPEAGETRFA